MSNATCPQEVLDYISQWGDLEPLESPAKFVGKDFELQNVWAIWYDERMVMHAVDYTDGKLKDWLFTNAYPISDVTPLLKEDGVSVEAHEIKLSAIPPHVDRVSTTYNMEFAQLDPTIGSAVDLFRDMPLKSVKHPPEE